MQQFDFVAVPTRSGRLLGKRARTVGRTILLSTVVAASAGLATLALAALESPKPQPAQKYLGASVSGPNYTVKPTVRSDGVMRIFDVDTSYGKFTFEGIEFAKLRL